MSGSFSVALSLISASHLLSLFDTATVRHILALYPVRTLPPHFYIWNLISYILFEPSFISLLLSLLGIFLISSRAELQFASATNYLQFILFTNSISGLILLVLYYASFLASPIEEEEEAIEYLYSTYTSGHWGVVTAAAMVLKSSGYDADQGAYFGVPVLVQYMPTLLLSSAFILYMFGPASLATSLPSVFATAFTSWYYLLTRHSANSHNLQSESVLTNLMPTTFLPPLLSALFSPLDRLCMILLLSSREQALGKEHMLPNYSKESIEDEDVVDENTSPDQLSSVTSTLEAERPGAVERVSGWESNGLTNGRSQPGGTWAELDRSSSAFTSNSSFQHSTLEPSSTIQRHDYGREKLFSAQSTSLGASNVSGGGSLSGGATLRTAPLSSYRSVSVGSTYGLYGGERGSRKPSAPAVVPSNSEGGEAGGGGGVAAIDGNRSERRKALALSIIEQRMAARASSSSKQN
mgnify:CR=1 FL=1